MEIRVGTHDDLEGIYAIEETSFSHPWSLDSMSKDLENPVATYLVAEEDKKIIGYIGVWSVMGEGQITNIAVDKAYRKQSVASRLVEALIEHGTKNDLFILLLEVRQSNTPAQKLYTKFGFKAFATRKGYYSHPKEDAIMMALNLGE